MFKYLDATYNDGKLLLNEKLNIKKENEEVKVIVIIEEDIEEKKRRFFENVKKHSFTLPEDYIFNRDEANER